MTHHRVAACAIAATIVSCAGGAASAASTASVLLIWRVPAPLATTADVQPVEAGLVAINFLAPQLAALERHPGAKLTLALDPIFVNALQRAAQSSDALAPLDSGALHADDPRAGELLQAIVADVVPATSLQLSKASRRFVADASAARLAEIGGAAANFSHADDVDFVANALLLSLQSSSYAQSEQPLLERDMLSSADLAGLSKQFALACQGVLDDLRRSSRTGTVELAALPAYEPIVPLVIDAAGRTERAPFTVFLNASADAAAAVDEGLAAVAALDPQHGAAGVVSPNGAYDDETIALFQAHHARYGVFSDRVVKQSVGAAVSSVADARVSAFRTYLMETTKTATIPILFCSDTASTSIDSVPLRAPASVMADGISKAARAAGDAASALRSPIVVLCLPATGSILHRSDRAEALDAIAAALSTTTARGSTPRDVLSASPPTSYTYGYEATSDAGDFSLWMGSANQVSMWNALEAARQAAGGDSAVADARVRDALLQAEAGRWYLALALVQPRYLTESALAAFRDLIGRVYRDAGKPVPRNIAPVKYESPTPAPTIAPALPPVQAPKPSLTPSPAATPAVSPSPASPSPAPSPS
jgi:hypothetical protein